MGAWGFDEASGSQAQDASGRGGTGTIAGATRAAGRFGGGLSFDGLDDWVTVADSNALDLTSAMTLEAWVNPSALGARWRTALLKENGTGLAYALYANDGANRAAGFINTGSDQGVLSPAGASPVNTWTHLATTYDGATLRVFANGAQVATRNQTGTIRTSTSPLRFGGNGAWLDEFFQGRLDEIRIYDRALTAAQISSDMNAPIGPPPPAPPRLAVTPASLAFSATQDGANPDTKSLVVANTGGGSLSYTASDNASWLSVTPATGSAPQNLTASVNISGLAAGTYTATVTVTSPGAQGSPASIPVTLSVAPPPTPPQLSVTPASLSFSGTAGGASPAAKSLAVANTGGGTLTFTASDDAAWLAVTPTSGSAPQSLSVSVDTTGLAAGTYSGSVTVSSSGVQGSPAAIPVTLTVDPAPAPALSVTPASLSFNATAGGAARRGQDARRRQHRWRDARLHRHRRCRLADRGARLRDRATGAHGVRQPCRAGRQHLHGDRDGDRRGRVGLAEDRARQLHRCAAPPPTGLVAACGFDETADRRSTTLRRGATRA